MISFRSPMYSSNVFNTRNRVSFRSKENESKVEDTFVIIKPDAVRQNKADAIVKEIKGQHFEIVEEKEETLSIGDVKAHYSEKEAKPYFKKLIAFMTSGPSVLMVIRGDNAIQRMRDFAIDVIRPKYGNGDLTENIIHTSDSPKAAEKELNQFRSHFSCVA